MAKSQAVHSRLLKAFIYLHWFFPLGYIIVLTALYNFPASKSLGVFFDPYFLARSGFAVWLGWLLHRSKPWAWHVFVLHSILIIVEQIYVGIYLAENNTPWVSVLLASTCVLIGLVLVKFEFRVPYYSPKIAWWEADPRYKISVPVEIVQKESQFEAEILDISASGCFVKISDHLPIDETLTLKFSLFEDEYDLNGATVWHAESALTHPRGVGIRFQKLDKSEYTRLKKTVRKLHYLSQKLRRVRKEEKASVIEAKINASTDEN